MNVKASKYQNSLNNYKNTSIFLAFSFAKASSRHFSCKCKCINSVMSSFLLLFCHSAGYPPSVLPDLFLCHTVHELTWTAPIWTCSSTNHWPHPMKQDHMITEHRHPEEVGCIRACCIFLKNFTWSHRLQYKNQHWVLNGVDKIFG